MAAQAPGKRPFPLRVELWRRASLRLRPTDGGCVCLDLTEYVGRGRSCGACHGPCRRSLALSGEPCLKREAVRSQKCQWLFGVTSVNRDGTAQVAAEDVVRGLLEGCSVQLVTSSRTLHSVCSMLARVGGWAPVMPWVPRDLRMPCGIPPRSELFRSLSLPLSRKLSPNPACTSRVLPLGCLALCGDDRLSARGARSDGQVSCVV